MGCQQDVLVPSNLHLNVFMPTLALKSAKEISGLA